MKKTWLVLAVGLLVTVGPLATGALAEDQEKTETTVFQVANLTCSETEARLLKILQNLDGVVAAKADFTIREAEVRYLPEETSPDQLLAELQKKGFRAAEKKDST